MFDLNNHHHVSFLTFNLHIIIICSKLLNFTSGETMHFYRQLTFILDTGALSIMLRIDPIDMLVFDAKTLLRFTFRLEGLFVLAVGRFITVVAKLCDNR